MVQAFIIAAAMMAPNVEVCTATVFGFEGDKLAGGVSPYLGRRVRASDMGIAHRTLPLGSKVRVVNLEKRGYGRQAVVRVIDTGPFGRRTKWGKWYNGAPMYRRYKRAGRPIPVDGWNGCADMTRELKRRLRHSGKGPVMVIRQ